MKLIDKGILHEGIPGGSQAIATFTSFTAVDSATVLAVYRVGSTKDGANEEICLRRSEDGGTTWLAPTMPFPKATVNGMRGTLKIVYLTVLSPQHLIAAAMWVDRESHPGAPLFNPETEGCLPMSILLSDSHDTGFTWTAWREVPVPEEIGPASLTNPICLLADGSLVISIETNKHYNDTSDWQQRVVHLRSHNKGESWSFPETVARDPEGNIFYWDQRLCTALDGRIATFSWTYDRSIKSYLNIHRNTSDDNGRTWKGFVDLGFADQAARPAVLPDGRVILAWVDRFGTSSIRVRVASDIDAPFLEETESIIYQHKAASEQSGTTGGLLDDMDTWSFGLPFVEAITDTDVLIGYYAGSSHRMDFHWARYKVPSKGALEQPL